MPKKTQHISITKIIWLIMFRKIIIFYSENCDAHKYTVWAECELMELIVLEKWHLEPKHIHCDDVQAHEFDADVH
jgi:hypothetical protein